ncbi:hypothetical protein RRG08_041929 [Elysia crispata]|uniref:Uncharacterized protein n=1 Tax=Elysia crispata TaxID=231223 RepID=A0AAE0XX63_9GAST|nr:hypothetical protein RRG08_041929 [Elysia crispata]
MSTLDMKQSRVYQFGKRLLEFVLLWVFCGGFFGTKPELTKSLWAEWQPTWGFSTRVIKCSDQFPGRGAASAASCRSSEGVSPAGLLPFVTIPFRNDNLLKVESEVGPC